ncbi:MAG TPA: S16 family serine protease, partial [Ktedonobacterales bacterium]
LLPVEVATMPGKGNLMVTGQLGDVMQESARAALSYIRSRSDELEIPPGFADNLDLHIHLPEGAIPKDGPSAGITIATAIISALTRRPVRSDLAMTGEITLRGRVLAIGGLKEKTMAAHRVGIRHLLVPAENQKDLADIPPKIRADIQFTFVDSMDGVLVSALLPPLPGQEEDGSTGDRAAAAASPSDFPLPDAAIISEVETDAEMPATMGELASDSESSSLL